MSEYVMQYDLYKRRYLTSYRYLSPLGMLWLVDENGDRVVDYHEAPEQRVAEARAFMVAESAVHTLRMMDAWL